MSKLVIFDFDGTIADTVPFLFSVINDIAVENGLKRATDEEIEKLRDKTIKEAIKIYNISPMKLVQLIKRVREEISKNIETFLPFNGIPDLISSLKAKGYVVGIMSSNSKDNIVKFLEKNNITNIDFVSTSSNLLGKSKSINKLISKYQAEAGEAFYIGDEIRDVVAAHKAKAKAIAVSWGANTIAALQKTNPEYLVSKPGDILSIL